jgi:cell fate (sporulation/competence/biofilm development) regulator YlbF (YheA/YmcA/DUF963 family)
MNDLDELMNNDREYGYKDNQNGAKEVLVKQKLNISDPSVDYLENIIQVKMQTSQFDDNNKQIHRFEPDIEKLEAKLHDNMKKESSNEKKDDDKEKRGHDRAILPGYEGFHGVIMHDNEAYLHENPDLNEDGDLNKKAKVADIDDYKKWLANEEKQSRLDRFKNLQNEISRLEKKMHRRGLSISKRSIKTIRSVEEHVGNEKSINSIEKANEKLALIIKEIEQAEKRKNQKNDL